MPHKDPKVSAAYKAAWSKTPAGRASHSRATAKYRSTAKGMLADVRVAAKRRGAA